LETIHTSTSGAISDERAADALFVMIGAIATTNWLPEALQRDAKGFILTGPRPPGLGRTPAPFLLETSMPGYFAQVTFVMTRSRV